LGHQALVGLLQHYIQREAAYAFVVGVKDWEMKQQLLMGGDRMLNEALKLEALRWQPDHQQGCKWYR
jgi:hypothetical protein